MKRNLWIAILFSVVAVLAIRAVYLFYHRGENDRDWFLKHLDYDFRTKIDSVVTFPNRKDLAFLVFRNVAGKFDRQRERKLNAQLKQRTMKCVTQSEGAYRIYVRNAEIQSGDSLFVNSTLDSLTARRNGKTIYRATISGSAYGKPWR